MRRAVWIIAALSAACSFNGPEARSDSDGSPARPSIVHDAGPTPENVSEPPPFPDDIQSLRIDRSIAVRFEPTADSKNLGTVAAHTRVGFKRARSRPGSGCSKRWIEIEPRGWICEVYLSPSKAPPAGVELPKLDWDEIVPGEYGKVTAKGARTYTFSDGALQVARSLVGSATVRRYGGIELGGKSYWAIGGGGYLAESSIRRHRPTVWRGVRLGDDTGQTLPVAFAVAQKNAVHRVTTYSQPVGGAPVRKLIRRTPVPVLEIAPGPDGDLLAVRIGDDEWIRGPDIRIARAAEPPPLTGPHERWFDIDLDSQTLVAYEGSTPVYATVITSGKRRTPTPTGIFRVWIKFAETDMNGQMGDEAAYSVATVPWTQFYARDFALHTAYWHDGFGSQRSHGCINLTPADARYLYFWSSPDVPPGWSMAHGVFERPGSMVRIRSAADPDPEFQGYARRVHDARVSAHSASGSRRK